MARWPSDLFITFCRARNKNGINNHHSEGGWQPPVSLCIPRILASDTPDRSKDLSASLPQMTFRVHSHSRGAETLSMALPSPTLIALSHSLPCPVPTLCLFLYLLCSFPVCHDSLVVLFFCLAQVDATSYFFILLEEEANKNENRRRASAPIPHFLLDSRL